MAELYLNHYSNSIKARPQSMADQQFKSLAAKIDDLIALCSQLNEENRTLKAQASQWHKERELLVEKTEIARTKVETMITRLKALEQES